MHVSVKGIILSAATLLWLLFALYLSHQTGDQTLETSMGLAKKLLGWIDGIDEAQLQAANSILRKEAHVFLYLVLAILMLLTFDEIWSGHTAAAAAVLLLIAVFDEVTKIPINGRHCSGIDIGLNILGAALGCALMALAQFRLKKRRS